jgi:glutamine amidotransferase
MCRHLAYLGPPVALGALLVKPEHSLLTQTTAPRHQAPGITNVHGFGVAWYLDGHREPRRYRTTAPMADDATIGGHDGIESGAVLAAARNASPGLPLIEQNNAPYLAKRWAFSHNGYIARYLSRPDLRAQASAERAARIEGTTDSELLFAFVLSALDARSGPATALALAIALVGDDDSKLNLLLTDGSTIWATRWGNSLFTLASDHAVVVASEPYDDDARWREVPDRSVVTADLSDHATITIGAL